MTRKNKLYAEVGKQPRKRIGRIDNIIFLCDFLIGVMLQKIVVHYHNDLAAF